MAVGVCVECCFTVGIVVVPIQGVGNHFLLDCPSSSPVMNTAKTMMHIDRNSVILFPDVLNFLPIRFSHT